MTGPTSFTNFFNNGFGLTLKSHERTLQQAGDTLNNGLKAPLEPLFTYLEENKNVFSGDIKKELDRNHTANFNINMALQIAHEAVNGTEPTFDIRS